MAKFKIGDRVKVISSTAGNHGQTGSICDVIEDSAYPYAIKRDNGCRILEAFTAIELVLDLWEGEELHIWLQS
jgi:hypothetical protein